MKVLEFKREIETGKRHLFKSYDFSEQFDEVLKPILRNG